jgi:hypothetical protein
MTKPDEQDALIALLSKQIERLYEAQIETLTREEERARLSLEETVRRSALLSVVETMADGLGLDRNYFQSRYQERCQYYRDQARQLLEK